MMSPATSLEAIPPDDAYPDLHAQIVALQGRLQSYERLLENFPGVVARFDRQHRHSYVSPGIEHVTGIPAVDFLGKTNRDLGMPADLVAQWDAALEQVFNSGRSTRISFSFPGTNGPQHYVSLLVPEAGPDGAVESVLASAHDITTYVRAEMELRRSQALLQSLLDHSPAIILIKDLEQRYQLVNRHLVDLLGRGDAEILGRTAADLFPPAIADAFEANDRQVLTTGKPLQIEEPILKGDEIHTQLSIIFPINDQQGSVSGLGVIATDITERKRLETALHEQEIRLERERALFSALLETLDEGVAVCDARGSVLFYNRTMEQITGYTRAEAQAKDFLTLLCQDRAGRMRLSATMAATLAGHPLNNQPWEIVHRDGGRRQVIFSLRMLTRDEHPLLIFNLRDVTAQHEAEAQQRLYEQKLQEAQRIESLGLLAGGIAHDFNNLLAIILGNAELASGDLPAASPATPSVNQIINAARRAAELTQQILAYAGRGRLIAIPLDLNELIHSSTPALNNLAGAGIPISYALTPRLPLIMADSSQLHQLLVNLVTNAVEAIGESAGQITITTTVSQITSAELAGYRFGADQPSGIYVQLSVSDTGIGMDAVMQEHIFDPFFTTRFTGRGLGLPVVLGVVQRHGGALRVQSIPGQGTTFTILLPVIPSQVTPPKPVATGPLHSRGTILIVDDEEGVRLLAASMLRRLGFTTLIASDGAAALIQVRSMGSDLVAVLLDLSMPGASGPQVFDEIQQIAPQLPIILMSGYSRSEVETRLNGQSFAGFLAKPFSLDNLRTMLAKALGPEAGHM